MLPRICNAFRAITRAPCSHYVRLLSTTEGGYGQPSDKLPQFAPDTTKDPDQFLFTTVNPRKDTAVLPSVPEWEIPPALIPTEGMLDAYKKRGRSRRFNKLVEVPPDADPLLAYLTSRLMTHGKRHAAAKRVSRALLHIHGWLRVPPLPILRQAVLLASPDVRIVTNTSAAGKKTYLPYPLSERQKTFYAVSWILDASSKKVKSNETVAERLAATVLEIVQARLPIGGESDEDPIVKNMPSPVKKKFEIHRLATVNR
jgi:small subunit ribosomal protein S7